MNKYAICKNRGSHTIIQFNTLYKIIRENEYECMLFNGKENFWYYKQDFIFIQDTKLTRLLYE